MADKIQKSHRYRVNISTSVKGVKTWDCIVEGENWDMADLLLESDRLVEQLERRYPVKIEEK